ncbi:lyar-type c2hc zinc finger [Lecanosticta acicola]|uniref:Lyar-type c2hc zinc finger n=1 Tax=Lecanosticta acicola TaxID=111012 RepID=A0AAI8YT96_9PEZI|nr:lyar-type c2hc zinc finger [Lecanosticta acicola]
MVHFPGTEYRSHTSCISEAQKYQGHLYRPEKEKGKGKRKSMNGNNGGMVPRGAYVEDAVDGDEMNAVAVIDVPPRAPTPPPAPEALPENVNVFDFLVSDATPKGAVQAPSERRMLEHATPYGNASQYSQYSNGNGSHYLQHGYSYGDAPLQSSLDRYDSWHNFDSQQTQASMAPPPYVTPKPRKEKKDKRGTEKSGSKRKRNVDDLDLSSVKRPVSRDEAMTDAPMTAGKTLHSGLTGGLSKLITDPGFYEDRIEAGPTPISPIKRNKREKEVKEVKEKVKEERRKSSYVSSWNGSKAPSSKHGARDRSRSPEASRHADKHRRSQREASFSSEDRSRVSRRKAIEYPDRPGSVQPSSSNQVVSYRSRAELFLSFINKGPESERGCSINKALKRYHRERDVRGEDKEEEDKELWKSLRLRRNSRGETVLFV